jgi:hypothetical protein
MNWENTKPSRLNLLSWRTEKILIVYYFQVSTSPYDDDMWAESQATIALKKIAQPEDVARTIAFLTSHKASGHITSEYISVDGGIEGRVIFKESRYWGRVRRPIQTVLLLPRHLH